MDDLVLKKETLEKELNYINNRIRKMTERNMLWYREHPREFFDQAAENQAAILTAVHGPAESFVYPGLKDAEIRTYPEEAETSLQEGLGILHREENWALYGMVMLFFRREFLYLPGKDVDREKFEAFARVFPFGSVQHLDLRTSLQDSDRRYLNVHWAEGVVTIALLKYATIPDNGMDDANFEILAGELRKESLTWVTAEELVEEITDDLDGDFREDRARTMVAILSQKYLTYSPQDRTFRQPVPYLCLRESLVSNHDYDEYEAEIERKLGMIPEPRWSRANHLLGTSPFFQKQTLTVLLMQKFRRAAFPLHKDLLDLVLGHLFALEFAELRRYAEEKARLRKLPRVPRAAEVEQSWRVEMYRSCTGGSIAGFTDLVGHNLLEYCRMKGIMPEEVLRGRVKLSWNSRGEVYRLES